MLVAKNFVRRNYYKALHYGMHVCRCAINENLIHYFITILLNILYPLPPLKKNNNNNKFKVDFKRTVR